MSTPPSHPLRFGISGDEEKIAALKEMVDTYSISPHLRGFLKEELDKFESNAAQVHLKILDVPAGVDLHVTLRKKFHGRRVPADGAPAACQ